MKRYYKDYGYIAFMFNLFKGSAVTKFSLRCSQDPWKHLRWRALLKGVNYCCKTLHLRFCFCPHVVLLRKKKNIYRYFLNILPSGQMAKSETAIITLEKPSWRCLLLILKKESYILEIFYLLDVFFSGKKINSNLFLWTFRFAEKLW